MAACSAASSQTRSVIEQSSLSNDEIVIIHTNDVHGNIRPVRATWINRDSREPDHPAPMMGGTAALSTFIKGWRKIAGGDTGILLVDAGDIYQGTPEGNETKGRLAVELMNLLKYDAGAIGNHEFDYGVPNLLELLKAAHFPMMADNLRESVAGGPSHRPASIHAPVIIDYKGIKVGIAGLITEDLAKVTTLDPTTSGWYVSSEVEAAREAAVELRDKGADMVILLTHCGVDHDSIIAQHYDDRDTGHVSRIDLIIGGHSHTRLDKPLEVNGIPIVQIGSGGKAAGELRIHWDRARKKIAEESYRVVDLFLNKYPEDTVVTNFLAPWIADIDKRMNVVVGRARAPIMRGGHGHASSPLGNLQTDVMRLATGADIAFQNKGGIRADVAAGDIRLRDAYAVSPFGNTLVTMDLTGAQVRAILEQSVATGVSGLEISGLTVYYDMSRNSGDRLVNVFLMGKGDSAVVIQKVPLQDAATYHVATTSFLGGGGDGYPHFKFGKNFHDTGRNFLDVEVANYTSHPDGVTGPVDRRWRSIDEP